MKPEDIDVALTAHEVEDARVRGKQVVIVDILRASSTMITALANGADAIYPVYEMEQAQRLAATLDRASVLTCGERNGLTIQGFDIGNSPMSCTPNIVTGKRLIMTTTNGTHAIEKAKPAKKMYIAGFLNASAVLQALMREEIPVLVVCSGWKGRSSLEDTLFAGYLVHHLLGKKRTSGSLHDSVKMALSLYWQHKDSIEGAILKSDHARRLKGVVDAKEMKYCSSIDVFDVVPVYKEGMIRLEK